MSRQLALDTIALKPVSRFARTEYSLEYHQLKEGGGTGPGPDRAASPRAYISDTISLPPPFMRR